MQQVAGGGGVSLGRQVLRRHVNERISAVAGSDANVIDVLCECGRSRCAERIRIAADVYAELGSVSGRYVVSAAHANGATAAEARNGYVLVDRDASA